MTAQPRITRELLPVPARIDNVHKGDVGRIVVVGGCADSLSMPGAPAMVALSALRSGAGLVQVFAPRDLHTAIASLVPCATLRVLPEGADAIVDAAREFHADVMALGPGLGESLQCEAIPEIINAFSGAVVVDADGLNLLARTQPAPFRDPSRMVLTPHPGEASRLLKRDSPIGSSIEQRQDAALRIVQQFGGCNVVLKGPRTIVTNGDRLFMNQTGNSGMATAGAGDVLTGIIAALIGQKMDALEAAMLGAHLHGLAGDFAAEELGRHSMIATDIIQFLPEAFCDHDQV